MADKRKRDAKAEEVRLIPEPEFAAAMRKILKTGKAESDEQIERLHAKNGGRSAGQKPKPS